MQDTVSDILFPIQDNYLTSLKSDFFSRPQKQVGPNAFKGLATDWFRSTKLNDLQGWDKFKDVDIILGCTHYIESTCLKYGWDIQHLPNEYSYYRINGKQPTQIDDLRAGIPLIISLPTWQYCDIHPDWDKILLICEKKKIDIHIDGAWFQSARNIQMDFDHPNIKSFAMSIGKGIDVQWNRIGIRWSRQKTIDSITLMNELNQIHHTAIACGAYIMKNVEKDYAWNKYADANKRIADRNGLQQTNSCHVLKDDDNQLWGIGQLVARL